MTAAAISGTFADYRLVKSRGVLQIVIECPVEEQAAVFAALGYPMPGESLPVAVARLQASAAEASTPSVLTAVVPERAENRDANSFNPLTHYGRGCSDPPAESRDATIVKRAGILSSDKRFWAWINVADAEAAAAFIRRACAVESRRDLATNTGAAIRFQGLLDEYLAET